MTRALELGGGDQAAVEWEDLQAAVAAAARVGVPVPCSADPDAWFVHGRGGQEVAAQRCAPCLARLECAAYALAADERVGVWGGMSEVGLSIARARGGAA